MVWGNLATGYWLGGAAAAGLHWVELGRTTLSGSSDTIAVTSLAAKPYMMVLGHGINSGQIQNNMRFNNDSGNNYANGYSNDGGSNSNFTSQAYVVNSDTYTSDIFQTDFIMNESDQEKIGTGQVIAQNAAGAGTAPRRTEYGLKWANTSDSITSVSLINTGSGDYASGSEVVVLGYDPDDTEGTSVWEELKSVELTSNGNLSTGTFTAKKYLMVQTYFKPTSANTSGMVMNNDTAYNYANRRSKNGGTDETRTSSDSLAGIQINGNYNEGDWALHTSFIINKSDKEKLSINEFNAQNTAGAGNAPERVESVGKWTNTSSQITEIDITDGAGGALTLTSGSRIKVWGFD